MTNATTTKIINRIGNMSLQEKRAWRSIVSAMYTDLEETSVAGDFAHDSLASIPANDHIDWTADQGATNIHTDNYVSTYVEGDYYGGRHSATTAYQIDDTLGYETGMPVGYNSSSQQSGFTSVAGITVKAITTIADSAGSPGTQILVTTSAPHGFSVGDLISISETGGAESYNILYTIVESADTTSFEVTEAFTATQTGLVTRPSTLVCNEAGTYRVVLTGTFEASGGTTGFGYITQGINGAWAGSTGKIKADSVGANLETAFTSTFIATLGVGGTLCWGIASVNWGGTVIMRNLFATVTRV